MMLKKHFALVLLLTTSLANASLPPLRITGQNYITTQTATELITAEQINLAGTHVTGILPNANTTATSANTASAIVARGASGEFSMGALTASTGDFSGTLRVGTATYAQTPQELGTFKNTLATDDGNGHNSVIGYTIQSTNTPTTGSGRGVRGIMQRTITTNVTDTAPIQGVGGELIFSTGGFTYANSNVIGGVESHEIVVLGGGTVDAPTAAFVAKADSVTKSNRKMGIYLGPSTGSAAGNVAIADNTSFSGDYFINSTNTNPSVIGGTFSTVRSSINSALGVIVNNTSAASGTTDIETVSQLFLKNDAGVGFRIQQHATGSTSAVPLTGGPTGVQADVFTDTAYPLVFGTNNTAVLTLDTSQNATFNGNSALVKSFVGALSNIVNNTASAANTTDIETLSQMFLKNASGVGLRMQQLAPGATSAVLISGGPTGVQAGVFTDTTYPLTIGTNNTAAINIDTSQKVTATAAFQANGVSTLAASNLFGTTTTDKQTIVGDPTRVRQIVFGNNAGGTWASVGTRITSGALQLVHNAYQTTENTDSFTQSNSAVASARLAITASGLTLHSAASGTSPANNATFWGSAVFSVNELGSVTVGNQLIVPTSASPAAADACTAGRIVWDASYIYVCTASGAWKRSALTGGY